MDNRANISAAHLACANHAQFDEAMPPAPIARPPLALWLWRRGMDWRAAGDAFGVSHQTVFNWCKPFSDPTRSEPRPKQAERVARVTSGEIQPDSFKAPPALAEPQP